jgi:hypothetical protein
MLWLDYFIPDGYVLTNPVVRKQSFDFLSLAESYIKINGREIASISSH